MADKSPGNLIMETPFHEDAANETGAMVTLHEQSGMV
jgi:hypothetical protein